MCVCGVCVCLKVAGSSLVSCNFSITSSFHTILTMLTKLSSLSFIVHYSCSKVFSDFIRNGATTAHSALYSSCEGSSLLHL